MTQTQNTQKYVLVQFLMKVSGCEWRQVQVAAPGTEQFAGALRHAYGKKSRNGLSDEDIENAKRIYEGLRRIKDAVSEKAQGEGCIEAFFQAIGQKGYRPTKSFAKEFDIISDDCSLEEAA